MKKHTKDIIAAILTAAVMVAFMFMFLNAWANEKTVTMHDHMEDVSSFQYANVNDTVNWCTEK